MELIDRNKLEPDTEWSDYYDDNMSYSSYQIKGAPTVKAVPLDKIKKVREELQKCVDMLSDDTLADLNTKAGLGMALEKIDKLLESEEYND